MKTKTTWEQVMALKTKDTRHKGLANTLTQDEIETIAATADFFNEDVRQIVWDLKVARYRVFDWLAMGIGGRIGSETVAKIFAYSFIKVNGDIDKWIDDLRVTDYEANTKWESIDLGR